MTSLLMHWLQADSEQLALDIATALTAAESSVFQQRGMPFVRELSTLLLDALRADLSAGGSTQLRATLRVVIERLGEQAVRFHDLRLLATTLRRVLLDACASLPGQDGGERLTLDDWLFQVPIHAALHFIRRSDELIRRQYSDLELRAAEQRSLNVELQALTTQQQSLLAQQQELISLIEQVSIPIAVVFPQLLVVPLVGRIDQRRAQMLIERVLEATVAHQADVVLIDISGVPLFDTQVAQALVQTAKAAGLLGARIVLVGISPEIAQTVVQLAINLSGLVAHSTLREGIAYALQLQGRRVGVAAPNNPTNGRH
jgi:anti-anti-sigma regulatory factor